MRNFIQKIFITVLTAFLLSCTGAAKKYETGVIPAAKPPSGTEIAKTRTLLRQEASKSKMKLYTSGPYYNRAKRILKRISKAAGLRGFSYPLYIADKKNMVNAMAVNDNTIVVSKKLMDNVRSDSKLAVIMAHEVAHILSHHGHDNVIKNRTAAVAIGATILGAVVAAKTGNSDAGSIVRDIGTIAGAGSFLRPYNRSMELEADHIGMLLMAKAGYNPREAIYFWQNSQRYLGSSGGGSFLSTHPQPNNRLAKLKETLPLALKYYKR